MLIGGRALSDYRAAPKSRGVISRNRHLSDYRAGLMLIGGRALSDYRAGHRSLSEYRAEPKCRGVLSRNRRLSDDRAGLVLPRVAPPGTMRLSDYGAGPRSF